MLLCMCCRALRPLINVFGGQQLLLMADAAVHWVGGQGAVINCPELLTVKLETGMEDDLRRFHGAHVVEARQRIQCIEAGLTMLHKVLTFRNIWCSPKVGLLLNIQRHRLLQSKETVQAAVYSRIPGAAPGCCMWPRSSLGHAQPCRLAALQRKLEMPNHKLCPLTCRTSASGCVTMSSTGCILSQ